MKKSLVFLCTLTLVFALVGVCAATTLDFETNAIGTYNQLFFTDLTIAPQNANDSFQVTNATPGPPISGHSLITYYSQETMTPLVATFSIADVTSFSIGVGDYDADVDNTYLQVFDSANNLLASDYYQNPASTNGGSYLSVTTASSIAYAVFWDADPFPGAVYWDNLTYEQSGQVPVPEPATLFLLGSGLIGLAALRKKKFIKKQG